MIILSYVSIEQLKKADACFALDWVKANPGCTVEDLINESFDGRKGGGKGMAVWLAARFPAFRKEVRRLLKGDDLWLRALKREIAKVGK